MAAMAIPKRFALDTNLLFDLAEEKDFAHTFIEVFHQKGYGLFLPPTCVQELAYEFKNRSDSWELAARALRCMRDWNVRPFDLAAVGHGITEQFSLLLQTRGLLPSGENNDGYILAETALAEIPILVTSDRHLLDIDSYALESALRSNDLSRVAVAHPKNLLAAVKVRTK